MKNILIFSLILLLLPIIYADIWTEKRDNSYVFCKDDWNGMMMWDYKMYHRYIKNSPCEMMTFAEKSANRFEYQINWNYAYSRDLFWDGVMNWQYKIAYSYMRFNLTFDNTSWYIPQCNNTGVENVFYCNEAQDIIKEGYNVMICSKIDSSCISLAEIPTTTNKGDDNGN